MISRRHLLMGAGTAVAGVAAGVVLTVNNPFESLPSASAAADERFTYRGRDVTITPHGNMASVRINGKREVHAERFQNEYLCHLLPFTTFRSPRKLGEAVIEAEDAGLLVV